MGSVECWNVQNWTDWAHLVSTDMVRWTRLPSALTPNGDWDGSLTVLGDGNPVIMYDCCKPPPLASPLLPLAQSRPYRSLPPQSPSLRCRCPTLPA